MGPSFGCYVKTPRFKTNGECFPEENNHACIVSSESRCSSVNLKNGNRTFTFFLAFFKNLWRSVKHTKAEDAVREVMASPLVPCGHCGHFGLGMGILGEF